MPPNLSADFQHGVDVSTCVPSMVGREPVPYVTRVENHDDAYHVWRSSGLRSQTLLHIDAHHDMWWTPEPETNLNIANFICYAIREGIVARVVWVVPDAAWQSSTGRRAVWRHVKCLAAQYPNAEAPVRRSGTISVSLNGCLLTVCSIGNLPTFDRDVLLDIDTDFLLIPVVSFRKHDCHASLPWCWPEELVNRLRLHGVQARTVTVACSREGGYTPLGWTYLCDELVARLQDPEARASRFRGFAMMRSGAQSAASGDPTAARSAFEAASHYLPKDASPYCQLALLEWELGCQQNARRWYAVALALDPQCRHPYNNTGLWLYKEHRFKEARREFNRMLDLDPNDAYAHYGLALVEQATGNMREAETSLRTSLALKPDFPDAYRLLGEVLEKCGQPEGAIAAYERYLRTTLAGRAPLSDLIATRPNSTFRDPTHGIIHARRASLYRRLGDWTQAVNGYRMASAFGFGTVAVSVALLYLYGARRQWRDALGQFPGLLKAVYFDALRFSHGVRKFIGDLRFG